MRMLLAFVAVGMLAIVACACPARADTAVAPVAEDEWPGARPLTADEVLQEALAAYARQDYATELALLRPLAEQGNATAQFALGDMYHSGDGVPQDDGEAARWWRKAAEQGDADAQFNLGLMYKGGQGVSRNYTEAARWLRKAAEQGDANARYTLGVMYYKGQGVPKDDSEAITWWRRAAEQESAKAQTMLGLMYARGQGVPQNWAETVKWWGKAAQRGDVDAQTKLGLVYADGQGVPKNDAEAARWLRKAAEQGNADAQYNLGVMYYEGRGVPKNLAEAFRWFGKAAAQKNPMAQGFLGIMYLKGQGIAKSDAEAIRWFRKAADQGDSGGQGLLGMMLEFGQGVPRDYVQAYMWNNLAAAGGNNAAAQGRDRLEHLMTAAQIAEAQQRTAAWRPVHPGKPQAAPGKPDEEWAHFNPRPMPESPKPAPKAASGQLGTGFFIGDGVLLTNAHVVKGCLWVGIPHQGGSRTAKAKSEYWNNPDNWDDAAQVVARDDDNDLALLSVTIHPPAVAALRLSVRQGEAIAAYGYPLPGLLASGGNLTTGNITALSGIGDDSRLLQISAPVQPGNSGGPLLDGAGNVVGIVEGKLNAIKVAAAVGDVPQNINFAIKASVMAAFLDSNGIHYATGVSADGRSPADIAENARRFTVPVECRSPAR